MTLTIRSLNPATEEIIEEFEPHGDAHIDAALDRSVQAFREHAWSTVSKRSTRMQRAAEILEDEKQAFARMMTEEMGKPLAASVAEVEKCAWVCRYYAENAEEFLSDRPLESDASRSFIRYQPMGPVLAVMPWNFPFWQVFRFAAPAVTAGNVGLLKHASNVPRCALAIEDIFSRAGFAEGVFQTLLIGSEPVARIIRDARVVAATLTGSEGAGSAVAETAGKAIKKTVLELGGSDAFIVMPSANFETAVDAAVTARTINTGQSCIAAKRFIVHEDIYRDFEDAFSERLGALKVGDPMEQGTDLGPLAMAQIRDDLDGQVKESVEAGAKRVCGAEIMEGKGYFYEPGILRNIPKDSPAFQDEIFGPVALMFKIGEMGEAIELANCTRFGLGSAIWTTDDSEADRAATELVAGCTFVNSIVASDPRLPFGGVKASGYGRELSHLGMREFLNQKTISYA